MTIREFLTTNFANADKIDGIDLYGNNECHGARFVIDNDSRLFVLCGGRVIVGFDIILNAKANIRHAVFLVVDKDKLRLVYSI